MDFGATGRFVRTDIKLLRCARVPLWAVGEESGLLHTAGRSGKGWPLDKQTNQKSSSPALPPAEGQPRVFTWKRRQSELHPPRSGRLFCHHGKPTSHLSTSPGMASSLRGVQAGEETPDPLSSVSEDTCTKLRSCHLPVSETSVSLGHGSTDGCHR